MERKHGLRRKLFAWFGGLVFALSGIVGLGFLGIWQQYKTVTLELSRSMIYGDTKDAVRELDKLTNAQGPLILSLDRTFLDYVGIGDDPTPAYLKARGEMETMVKQLGVSAKSDQDVKSVKEFQGVFKRYKASGDKILKMSENGDYDAANREVEKSGFTEDIETMSSILGALAKANTVNRTELKHKQDIAGTVIPLIILCVIGIVIALSVITIPMVTKNISVPLYRCAEFAELLSNGDLTKKLVFKPNRIVTEHSEIGHLFNSLSDMSQKLHSMLENMNKTTVRVNKSSVQITQGAQSILSGTQEQSDSINDVTNSIQQLTSAIDTIADNSKAMNSSVRDTAGSVDNLIEAIFKIDESVADLTSQVSNTTAVIAQMSASTAQVHNSSTVMAEAVQETSSTIQEMLASIEEVSLNAKEMDKSVNDASGTVDEMMASINEMTRSMDVMNNSLKHAMVDIEVLISSVGDVANDAKQAFAASDETTRIAKSGGKSIQQSIEGMKGIKATVSDTARKIRELGDSSAQIGDIINVIREIADQTNLLALNAAIEAARAGEEGRGFNVVAASIKKLAERSTEATKEIERLIRNIQKETEKAVSAMDEGVKEVEKGTHLADQAGTALADIVASVERTGVYMKQISVATEKQTQSSEEVKQAMTRLGSVADGMNGITISQQEGTNRVRSAFDQLSGIAQQVKNSTIEQSKAGNQISHAIETLNGISTQLTSATSEQDKGSNQMELAMENINVRAQEIQDATRKQKGEGDRIKKQIENMMELTQRVTDATLLQSQSSHKIVEKMSNVGKIAVNTTNKSNEVNKGASYLEGAVNNLEQVISQFTIEMSEQTVPKEKGLSLVEEGG
ncbi:MAG: Methyl-accepting chemotaxis protein 2 [bacterium ADurb.Bin236]|nr:MAG: Methyl-accepting chemotaxis protein 2 [bacterium ADurb.Bin236]HOY62796.1 methyl-accepting chemotaxis protein [bacterium]